MTQIMKHDKAMAPVHYQSSDAVTFQQSESTCRERREQGNPEIDVEKTVVDTK